MQAPLALAGFALGLVAWWQTRDFLFLAGGIAMLANWPWTILRIYPGKQILDGHRNRSKPARKLRALISKWGWLHAVRTALGFIAVICSFCCLPFGLRMLMMSESRNNPEMGWL